MRRVFLPDVIFRRAGGGYYGVIPRSLKVTGRKEWVDDIIVGTDLDVLPQYFPIYQVCP